jgi:hypothetical protein
MRLGQHLFCTSTVLNIGSMHLHDEEVAFGINGELALASVDLFAAVKAALTTSFGGRPEGTRRFDYR